ncbi:hypothetical protein GCM10007301_36810 [Azorhizobium oxalatiphilum]|uniref:Glucosamine inositolphosphorylceramide transferase 1 N-terminal domain-containing protein n=1 Tax=Azorhizobium oxalatiphilum TaxID=980631 RepID=A0A917FDR3_9HYPH|nr:hypothetical protein [Azorhizobium oxalatiphilum]GGF73618.1 hypothetical protein GCM10007301_36810 [Azorhizobium oxalatiphilum]
MVEARDAAGDAAGAASAVGRLRLGVILPPGEVPVWVLRLLDDIAAGQVAQVVALTRSPATSPVLPALAQYVAEDQARTAEAPDPLALQPLALAAPLSRDLESVGPLDLVLDFGTGAGTELLSPPLGVWSLRFGGERPVPGGQALFREVAQGALHCDLVLLMQPRTGKPVVLSRSTTHVNDRSLWRTAAPVAWKARALVRRALERLHSLGRDAFLADVRASVDQTLPPEPKPVTSAEFTLFRARYLFRRFLVPYVLVRDQWRIGIRRKAAGDPPWGSAAWAKGFRFIEAPPGRFYADPFLFETGGKTFLFFEDWDWAQHYAVISVAEVAQDGTIGPARLALDTGTHLSNPLVFAHEGEIYMIPETLARRRVEVYRAAEFPTQWDLYCLPMEDTDIVDPCVMRETRADGSEGWLMFAAALDFGGSGWDELHIFRADELCGPWQPVGPQPALSDVRCARPGGRMWMKDGVLHRLTQNCAGGYGAGLGLYAVERLDETGYRQRPVAEVNAFDFGMNGVHAYDATDKFEVVDGRHYQAVRGGRNWYWPFPRWFGKH